MTPSPAHRDPEVLRQAATGVPQHAERERLVDEQAQLVGLLDAQQLRQRTDGARVGVDALHHQEPTHQRRLLRLLRDRGEIGGGSSEPGLGYVGVRVTARRQQMIKQVHQAVWRILGVCYRYMKTSE